MKQYLELLKTIEEKGTYKPAAREAMPSTKSLFGYQFRHDLKDGFPLLTTKKMFWKGVVIELLWFLRGDTNIKYLVDNGVNIWNEDAYQYYLKKCKQVGVVDPLDLDGEVGFIAHIKLGNIESSTQRLIDSGYTDGDCGYQYGKVWRKWEGKLDFFTANGKTQYEHFDQIKNLIKTLKNNPESRRHIITAIDPAHDTDLALYWCHAMFQFNCRPIPNHERVNLLDKLFPIDVEGQASWSDTYPEDEYALMAEVEKFKIPKYYLDCQLYQRSADVILGVPFNIASYALLTEVLAKISNMIPGEFIHTFGDVHIYENHNEAAEEQLKRTPTKLPSLKFEDEYVWKHDDIAWNLLRFEDFILQDYNPQESIKAKLSTGLK